MISLELHEAQLFRILTSFFGEEQVIHNMSLMAICGGTLPNNILPEHTAGISGPVSEWAKIQKCLFTVVDENDMPKLVFEFFSGFDKPFEQKDVEAQQHVKPILALQGVRYLTISMNEFCEILNPEGNIDFYNWLKDQVEHE